MVQNHDWKPKLARRWRPQQVQRGLSGTWEGPSCPFVFPTESVVTGNDSGGLVPLL